MLDITQTETFKKGSTASLVESFSISGLHGYRSVSLASPYAATILIAQNGSGKTTLLGVLDAFLKTQFTRLRELKFNEIRCRLNGIEEELVLNYEDIQILHEIPADAEIAKAARKYDLDPYKLFRYLADDYPSAKQNYVAMSDDPIMSAIGRSEGYIRSKINSVLERLYTNLYEHSARLQIISLLVKSRLKGIEVIYLPTYRRIELPLNNELEDAPSKRKRQPIKFPSSIFTGDIQFGLSDISQRLSELNQHILINSNTGYRQITADIVNELIDGTFERNEVETEEIPNREELSLFFGRIREGVRHIGIGPVQQFNIPDIEKIYATIDRSTDTNKFLKYFLSKLNTVIEATRSIESTVEDFIKSCNKYLSSEDISTGLPNSEDDEIRTYNIDDKVLRLDRKTLTVFAESKVSKHKVPLEALSSGEKQMVSLFAKIFLYPNEKILLIDEPELSLSIEWQRHILEDVVNAPLCQQVIAITHSPFVFDNALGPFARSLRLGIEMTAFLQNDDSEADDSDQSPLA